MSISSQTPVGTAASWPPSKGLTTVIVPSTSAILSTYASAHIDAPASLVFDVVRDLAAYPNWNSFCPRAETRSQPESTHPAQQQHLHLNTCFTFHCVMGSGPEKTTDVQLRITDISTPANPSHYVETGNVAAEEKTYTLDLTKVHRIAWTTEGGYVARGLKSERFHEIIDLGEGKGCAVRTWENQGGILARVVKYYFKDMLMDKFQLWCDDLKKEAERRVKGP